jgi:hypothetical protein
VRGKIKFSGEIGNKEAHLEDLVVDVRTLIKPVSKEYILSVRAGLIELMTETISRLLYGFFWLILQPCQYFRWSDN